MCLFSPSLHPNPAEPPSLPHLHPLPWFCPCVLYSSSCVLLFFLVTCILHFLMTTYVYNKSTLYFISKPLPTRTIQLATTTSYKNFKLWKIFKNEIWALHWMNKQIQTGYSRSLAVFLLWLAMIVRNHLLRTYLAKEPLWINWTSSPYIMATCQEWMTESSYDEQTRF